MRSSNPITILCVLLLAGCVPKAIIVEPITPAVTQAKGEVAAVKAATQRTQKDATETAKRISAVGEGIEGAIKRAEGNRATKADGTPEAAEWEDQWKLLTDIRTRNLFAEASAKATVEQSKEAQNLAAAADKSMENLETSAKRTDRATADLREENADLGKDAVFGQMIKRIAWIAIFIAAAILGFVFVVPAIAKAIRSLRP